MRAKCNRVSCVIHVVCLACCHFSTSETTSHLQISSMLNSSSIHIDELRVFLTNSKETDILAINETKLDPSIHDEEVHLPGYEIIRKDLNINGRNGGGVCIYKCHIVDQVCIFGFEKNI